VEIAICNTGAQLTPDQIPQVFDRFWRGDATRTNTGIHCGLGLTLVQRCITELGGTVSADVDDSRVFTVTVVLPAEVRRNPASS
jgi:signal transduction histidine kinase